MKNKSISRRKFIGDAVKSSAAIAALGFMGSCSLFDGKKSIPRRTLGKTGLEASILSFGGGSQFMKNMKGDWEKLMELAIDNGINLFDTAPSYSGFKLPGQDMGSEERFGAILPKYRDKILLSTKLETRDPKKVKSEIQASLSSLKTDYIDIYLIHAIDDKDDVGDIEKGIYKEMQQLKKAGIVRYIGFSSMSSAQRSKDLLENLDIDVAMLAMNPTRYGDYAKVALPSAIKQKSGVIAIKAMRNIVGKEATAKELMEYNLDHEGVATNMIAHDGMNPLKDNIQLAQNYQGQQLAYNHRQDLESRMAKYSGPHALCWARPGYVDGGTYYWA